MICKHWHVKTMGLEREWLVCHRRKIAMMIDEAREYCKMCPSREDA